MTHLLVTNDFPPKVGGIGGYLFELWRHLPPEEFAVLGIATAGSRSFDVAQPFRIERLDVPVLLPTTRVRGAVTALADEIGAGLVVLDPALPLGIIGPSLKRPYAVVLHGAEVTIPARLPVLKSLLGRALGGASLVVAAGRYPAAEARRLLGRDLPVSVVVPPSVDSVKFHPLDDRERWNVRSGFGLPTTGQLIVCISRLVPRKGMDVLIEASARLRAEGRELTVAIAGTGRDRPRLDRLVARLGAPVRMLGRVDDAKLPALFGAGDVFAMLCRNRWCGLEQEGFGIVFIEAAAAGVPQVAGLSGGTADAVLDGTTGLLVDRPGDVVAAALVLGRMLDDAGLRQRLAEAGRRRAVEDQAPERLAVVLADALRRAGG